MKQRKKELAEFHCNKISETAEKLFKEKGIENTTMDEIARESDYSKATVYVYFRNKEDIVNTLVLKSMQILNLHIEKAITQKDITTEKYFALCEEMVKYQKEYPFYFDLAIDEIELDCKHSDPPTLLYQIYEVGESINLKIFNLIEEGIKNGTFKSSIRIPETTFLFWSSLSGIIKISSKKREYIENSMGIKKDDFLEYSFHTLIESILTEKRNYE